MIKVFLQRSFEEKVEIMKRERFSLGQFPMLDGLGSSEKKRILRFFTENNIKLKDLRQQIEIGLDNSKIGKVSHTAQKNIIESSLTKIEFNKDKEKIVGEITSKGPFKSPKDLTMSIAQYIKENMNYDFLTRERLIFDKEREGILPKKDQESFERINSNQNKSSLQEEVVDKYEATPYHLKLFSRILNFKEVHNLKFSQEIENDFKNIQVFINENNPKKLKEYTVRKLQENKAFRSLIFSPELISTIETYPEKELSNFIYNSRTGVCRHYSVIMKLIYNEMIKNKKGIEFGKKSYMTYVINAPENHAYNLLFMEGKNGKIQKQYLDVTSMIMQGNLWKDQKDIKNKTSEIWVQKGDTISENYKTT